MARWFTSGMELAVQTSGLYPFFYFEGLGQQGTNATVSQDTTVKRTGAASRAHNSGISDALAYTIVNWGFQGANGYYARAYMRFSALPASTCRIMYFRDGLDALLVSARLTSGGKLQLWNETGTPAQIGSDSSATITTDAWYRIELHVKTVVGASDTSELKLDGTTVASASGASYSDTNTGSLLMGWLDAPGASKILYIDDDALNDDTGGSNNSFPGAGSVVYLDAVSDNARDTNWTAGAGGTSNLFEAVNNDPPVGVASGSATNTSQIKNTNTADTTGNYDANMESYETAGLDSGDTINLIQAVMQLGSSSATTVTGAVKIQSNPAGSEDSKSAGAGAAIGTYGSNWNTVWGVAINSPSVALATQPVLRIGRRGTEASEIHCCGMHIAVEFIPGEAAVEQLTADHGMGMGRW